MTETTSAIIIVTNIDWDTDGDEIVLPTTAQFEWWGDIATKGDDDEIDDIVAQAVGNALSNAHGWCVNDFDWTMEPVG